MKPNGSITIERCGIGGLAVLPACGGADALSDPPVGAVWGSDWDKSRSGWRPVEGSGVHFFATAVVHSTRSFEGGMVQRGTETVERSVEAPDDLGEWEVECYLEVRGADGRFDGSGRPVDLDVNVEGS